MPVQLIRLWATLALTICLAFTPLLGAGGEGLAEPMLTHHSPAAEGFTGGAFDEQSTPTPPTRSLAGESDVRPNAQCRDENTSPACRTPVASPGPSGNDSGWLQLPVNGPSTDLYLSQSVYDAADNYTVMYRDDCSGNCTWAFENQSWRSVSSNESPPPYPFTMTYDGADGYVLLFNGWTWEYRGGAWTNLSSLISGPQPQWTGLTTMAYDPADGYTLLLTGENVSGDVNQTWEWSAGDWIQVNVTGASPPAAESLPWDSTPLQFDAPLESLVLIVPGNYTYLYANGTWRAVSAAYPSDFYGAGASTYDPQLGEIVYFGGFEGAHNGTRYYSDALFAFNGSSWVQLNTSIAPAGTEVPCLSYDAADGWLLEFGGYTNNQTWIYGSGQVSTTIQPPSGGAVAVGSYDLASTGTTWIPFGDYNVRQVPNVGFVSVNLTVSGHLLLENGTYVLEGSSTISATFTPIPRLTIMVRPAWCSVSVNGVTYSNGAQPYLSKGAYVLVAPGCQSLQFDRFSVAGNGSLGNPSVNSTTLTVNGSLVLTTTFVASLEVVVIPSNGATVSINGTIVASNGTFPIIPGGYPLAIQDSPGWRLWFENTSGGVTVAGHNLTVNSSGFLEVELIAHPRITLSTNLARCPGLGFNGTSAPDFANVSADVGTYTAAAPDCFAATFLGWNATGGVSVVSAKLNPTTIVLTGNGTLTARYQPMGWVRVSVTPSAAAGVVVWNLTPVVNDTLLYVAAESFPVVAEPAASWHFLGWETTGAITETGGVVTVSYNGTLSAQFAKNSTTVTPPSNSSVSSFLGLSSLELAIAGAAVLAVAAVLSVFYLRRRRQAGPPGQPRESS